MARNPGAAALRIPAPFRRRARAADRSRAEARVGRLFAYNGAMPTKPEFEALLKEAMRSGDSLRKRTLRMILAAIKLAEVERRGPLDEPGLLGVLQKEARTRQEAIADAAMDNVRYLELRFTPVALSKAENFPLAEVIDWVIEGARQAQREHGILTRLIASVNRHESVHLAAEVAQLAVDRRDSGIVGLDLAGNEANFPASPFVEVFQEARQAGLHITVHAGEWGGAGNVAQAITQLGAERIGHGVRVMEDPAVVALAHERATTFEVCITSNYQTGVVSGLAEHPVLNMLAAGLNVTLNTDDPGISQITLSDEYCLAFEKMGISLETLRQRTLAAAQAAFLPEDERQGLVASLEREFPVA